MNLCDVAHCHHSHRTLLARLVLALTPWAITSCCRCGARRIVNQRTPVVRP